MLQIEQTERENKLYKDKWDELKNYVSAVLNMYDRSRESDILNEVLDKMEELEFSNIQF